MEDDLFDEFGNYIGEGKVSEESSEIEESQDADIGNPDFIIDVIFIQEPGHEVILHEDKRYYPDLEQVYPEAETLIMEEDAQPISMPIIQPITQKNFEKSERDIPEA